MKHKIGLSLDAQSLNQKPCLFTLNKGAHFNFPIMQFWDSDVNEDGHGADWPPVNNKGFSYAPVTIVQCGTRTLFSLFQNPNFPSTVIASPTKNNS